MDAQLKQLYASKAVLALKNSLKAQLPLDSINYKTVVPVSRYPGENIQRYGMTLT